jgi:ACS family hexuronate transporter-like MFS transporter
VPLGVFGVAAVPSIVGFMISRAVLAVGEAGNFPAAIKATAEYFPKKNAPSPPASSTPGANVGAILAPITVPVLAAIWGWQAPSS